MEDRLPEILVLSSHNRPGMTAPVNHSMYCKRNGYDYLFDATPYPAATGYDQKLIAVSTHLGRARWLFWADDDFYIMDQARRLEAIIGEAAEADFIFCDSPVNPAGEWTVLNSGAFFIRNTPLARDLLQRIVSTDLETVRAWWREDRHGLFTGGDQDKIVHVFATEGLIGNRVEIRNHLDFNARDYHFDRSRDEHFAVHFCGYEDKSRAVARLGQRLGLDRFLLPPDETAGHRHWLERSLFYHADNRPAASPGLYRRTRRLARETTRRVAAMAGRKPFLN